MKKILTLLISLSFVSMVYSQTKTITGTITGGDSNETLPGVSVVIKGTTTGTMTNLDGQYSITVEKGDELVFSFVGYISESILIGDQVSVDLTLKTDIENIDEVVVIGYGVQKKRDVTGAVSIVSAETIENLRPLKVENALQGTTTGVNVTTQSGAPGSGLDIRIRGISTNGDAAPVAIIDGYQGDLSLLNPDDIETITVLKDAQAAIYGTIGANGIILITTKQGKKNSKAKVSFNSSIGFQETTRKLPVLNATEYGVLLNESYAANGQAPPFNDISSLGIGTDWQDELFSVAPIQNHNISVNGGSEKVVYTLSASHLDQEGIIGGAKSGYKRSTARLSLGVDLSERIKFTSSLIYTNVDRKSINENGLGSVLFNGLNMPPNIPVLDQNGDHSLAPTTIGIEIINPLAQIDNTFNEYFLNKLNGNFGLDFEITNHIKATTRIGFNSTNSRSKTFNKIVDYGAGKVFNVSRSSVFQERDHFNDYTFDAFVTYENNFFEDHHVTATIGTTVFQDRGNHLEANGYDIPYNSWEFADIGLAPGVSDTKSVNSWEWDQRRLSYFGRLQYDYRGKYLLSAMLRRDASTRFGPEQRVAYFPSATLGWIVSDEDFMNNIAVLNFMKFRASYGFLGSDKIGDFRYIAQLDGEGVYVLNGSLVYGKAMGVLPNPVIHWEESEQFDVGFDFRLLDNQIDISTDYFIKTTNELLIEYKPVSGIFGTSGPGAGSPTENAGTVRNSGFEFAVGYKGNVGSDFNYSVNYNVTTLNNEVLEVNNGTGFIEDGNFGVGQPAATRMQVGLPIGYFYGYKTDGLFQNQAEVDAHPSQIELGAEASPGDIRYVDINNDGIINTDDRTNIGSPIPAATMGLNITMEYKGFDFVAYAYASIGNEMIRNYERVQSDVNRLSTSMNRWTGEGTSNTVPRLTTAATANNVLSDYYVEDASFLRIQNLQLGYTVPTRFTERVKIDKFRVYVGVSNLFTFTEYSGYDPAGSSGEPLGSGIDYGFYPAARTYTFGLNLNF